MTVTPMRDVTVLTNVELMAIPLDWPERLFDGTPDAAKQQYRRLAHKWHPDRNPKDGGVFAHVQVLFEAAQRRMADGTWRDRGVLKLGGGKDGEFVFSYRRAHPFELGYVYVGDASVAWVMDDQYEDLARAGIAAMKNELRYHSAEMLREHERHVPAILSVTRRGKKIAVTMKKSPDQFLLGDVLRHCGGRMDPRHVAWVVSTLLNINCYLNFTGVVHNAIGPDTYFVSPENHAGALLGGWWYAARVGQRIRALPPRTLAHGARDLATKRLAERATDSALIRATGRELLGDPHGSRLAMDPAVPRAMSDWLRGAGEPDSYAEYDHWHNKVLKDAFGPRRFVRMAVSASDIYKEQ